MPDKTTYKALANGTLVAHVPLTFARTPAGGRLFAREDGRNRDRNKELATVQTVALGVLWRRIAANAPVAQRSGSPTSVARSLAKQGRKRVRDRFPTRFKMAEHLRIDSSYLTRVVRLGYLSPYIVEKIAAGDLPHVSLETLMKLQTPVWAEQHKRWAFYVKQAYLSLQRIDFAMQLWYHIHRQTQKRIWYGSNTRKNSSSRG